MKETVLVADDDKTLIALLSDFLRKNGFHVIPAFDSMQAMVGARQGKPRAVILDIAMPGGSGIDVLKKLRAMSHTSQIKIVILTGSTDPKAEESAMGLGADEFMHKPPDLPALLSTLNQLLGRPDSPPVQ